ncbi:MAG: hypothetical protein EA424_12305, partial [Planctomycetaceae bacterium]
MNLVGRPARAHETGSSGVADLGQDVWIWVIASDNVGVTGRTLTIDGQPVMLDDSGAVQWTAAGDFGQVFELQAVARDAAGNVSQPANASLRIRNPDNQAPQVTLTSPVSGSAVTERTPIIGSIIDPDADLISYTITVTPLNSTIPVQTQTVAADAGDYLDDLVATQLGWLDATRLENGTYRLEVRAMDVEQRVGWDAVLVRVEGNLKLGNFSLTFIDLELPALGIPITITRTYDTLTTHRQDDFGYGWRMDIANVRVDLVQPGNDSLDSRPFLDGDRIVFTLPDGKSHGFTFHGRPVNPNVPFADPQAYPDFIPDWGNSSTLRMTGRHPALLRLANGYDDVEAQRLYNPASGLYGDYELTLRNGMQLTVDPRTGQLRQLIDRSGHRLTFTPDGIQHSSGRNVRFVRDHAGRITEIVLPDATPDDPNDNLRIRYQYDGRGDLVAVTDRSGATTRFTYLTDPAHYLDTIIDPLGRPVARTEYDEDGRVATVIDALGNRIQTSYDVDGRTQSITDPLGYTETQTMDWRGNIIRQVDPTGVIIKRTFDPEDRLLSETQVIGLDDDTSDETDDLTTVYVYNDAGDLVEAIDSRGNSVLSTYNSFGQPMTSTDPLGNTNRIHYDRRGLPSTFRDTLGNTMRMDFDDQGNLTSVRNPSQVTMVTSAYNQFGDMTSSVLAAGRTSYFDYTIDGDQAASWYFDGSDGSTVQILDRMRYDDNGRRLGNQRYELPEGQWVTEELAQAQISDQYLQFETRMQVDAAGQVVWHNDQDGLVTESRYDVRSLLIETRQQAVDDDGNTVWMVSRTVYDAAGRAVAYTDSFVEGSSEPIGGGRTFYDGAGRVIESQRVQGLEIQIVPAFPLASGATGWSSELIDAGTLISRSCTQHDEAGRVIGSVDHYGLQSQTVYNRHGDVVESRHQARDEHGQIVWLVSRSVYDEQGRVLLQTDRYQEDAATPIYGTQNVYDALGRNVETVRRSGIRVVLDAQDTHVADWGTELFRNQTFYDDQGRVARTVAGDGQTTRHEYDHLDRPIATIGHPLPIEQVGIRGYDPGTLVSLRSETVYDSLGQIDQQRTNIRQLTLPDGSTVIDDSEVQVTSYEYDARGNPIKTIFPDLTFITAEYDGRGRKIAETDQMNQTRTFEYDQAGRLSAVQLPGVPNPATGQIETPRYEYGYDAQGNQTLLRDPLGRETRFTFDQRNRQLSRTLPLGFGPDGIRGTPDDPVPWDGSTALPDSMPFTERMTYDVQGRLHLQVSFEGVVTQHVYSDANGRLTAKRFFANLTEYDGGNGTPSEVWNYTYDAFGRVLHVAAYLRDAGTGLLEPARSETTTYDTQGRVASVATDEGTVSYQYDQFGRLASTTIGTPSEPQRIISYTYDQLGRLQTVSEDQAPADPLSATLDTRYGYTLMGTLRRTDLPNGTIEKYVYDEQNRLDLLTHYGPDDTPEDLSDNPVLASYDYDLRGDGRRVGLFEAFYQDGDDAPWLTRQMQWDYDGLGRLIREVVDSSDDSLDYEESFLFDLASNRLEKTRDLGRNGQIDESIIYTYDANDRLWREAVDRLHGQATLTQYDWWFTQQIDKAQYDGTSAIPASRIASTAFDYDLRGRLRTATVTQYEGGTSTRIEKNVYAYDSRGIRTSVRTEIDANGDGVVHRQVRVDYLNDANNPTGYSQVLRESHYDADTDQLTKTIDYTFGHAELSQRTIETDDQGQVTDDQTLIFGHDGHGSVRVLTDLTAVAMQFYAYDAYGQMLALWNASGQLQSGGSGQYANAALAATTLLYAGEQFDPRIGHQYLRARYYDPTTARFTRLDPFFGNLQDPLSFHKYLYVHADPISGLDPSGAWTVSG